MSESIKPTSSSMIDLKAELYRKQEEFRNQKAGTDGFVKGRKVEKSGKTSIWNQKNRGVAARAKIDEQSEEEEDDDALVKSRRALEEKAKLYEKIMSSAEIPEEDGSDYFLVDFQKKAVDAIVEEREAQRKCEEEEREEKAEKQALALEIPEPPTPDEEWVDFTDSMGRSRRCMRKDLNQLMTQDKKLALDQLKKNKGLMTLVGDVLKPKATLVSEDDYKEKMRHKWEAETDILRTQDHGQVHYSNVQFDEIRNHGVGFLQFSKDHETREEQLDDLKKMREKTLDEKSRKVKIKDKRKAMMEARLSKVRQRRNLKDNTTEVKSEVVAKAEMETSTPETSSVSSQEVQKKKEEEKEAADKRMSHVRDWDKGKQTPLVMQTNYLQNRRQERDQEFAPPSAYFQEPGGKNMRRAVASDQARIDRLQTCSTKLVLPKPCETAADKDAPRRMWPEDVPETQSQNTRLNSEVDLNCIPLPSDMNSEVQQGQGNSKSLPPPQGDVNVQYPGDSTVCYPQWQQDHYLPSVQQPHLQHQWSPMQQTPYPAQIPQLTQLSYSRQLPYTTQPPHPTQFQLSDNFSSWNGQEFQYSHPNSYQPINSHIPTESSQCEAHTATPLQYSTSIPETNQPKAVKRPIKQDQSPTTNEPVKKKILPKVAIMDMRFMNNDADPSQPEMSTLEAPGSVTTIQYTPGSFTAARQASAEQYEDTVLQSRKKEQISGGPHLYTAQELEERQKQEEDEEAQEKVLDFLDSINSST